MLSFLGLPGTSNSIVSAVSCGYEGNFRQGTWMQIKFGILGGIVLLCVAFYYNVIIGDNIKAVIFLIAGFLSFGLWMNSYQSYWNGKKNFKMLFKWDVICKILQVFTVFIILNVTLNPILIFCGLYIISAVGNLVATLSIVKFGKLNNRISTEYQSYGRFSNYLYIVGSIMYKMDRFIVGFFYNLDKLAVFTIGELIYTYLFQTPKGLLDQVFIPRLSQMSLQEAKIWVRRKQPYMFLSITFLLLIAWMVLPFIYKFLFSNKYEGSIYFANLYLLVVFASIPGLLVGAIFRSHALKKESAVGVAINSFIPLILIPIFIANWEIKGIIFARLAQNIILSFYFQLFLWRREEKLI